MKYVQRSISWLKPMKKIFISCYLCFLSERTLILYYEELSTIKIWVYYHFFGKSRSRIFFVISWHIQFFPSEIICIPYMFILLWVMAHQLQNTLLWDKRCTTVVNKFCGTHMVWGNQMICHNLSVCGTNPSCSVWLTLFCLFIEMFNIRTQSSVSDTSKMKLWFYRFQMWRGLIQIVMSISFTENLSSWMRKTNISFIHPFTIYGSTNVMWVILSDAMCMMSWTACFIVLKFPSWDMRLYTVVKICNYEIVNSD